MLVIRSFPTTGGMIVDITGTLQNGPYSIPLTFTQSNGTPSDPNCVPEGWNFIGNPYASPINADMIQALGVPNLANSVMSGMHPQIITVVMSMVYLHHLHFPDTYLPCKVFG